MSIALIIFNTIVFVIGVVLLFVIDNQFVDGQIDRDSARLFKSITFVSMCLNVFIIVGSIKDYRNRIINNYKNNKYIEIVDYRYKTIDNVTTKVDSTFIYKVK